jgi:hypothetical protein
MQAKGARLDWIGCVRWAGGPDGRNRRGNPIESFLFQNFDLSVNFFFAFLKNAHYASN